MSRAKSVLVTKEMALTRDELLRALPSLAGSNGFHIAGDDAVICRGGGRILINLEALPDRRLGSLKIPAARVRLCFEGVPDADRQAFRLRFDTVLQRGGG